jgi:hypothetical protein
LRRQRDEEIRKRNEDAQAEWQRRMDKHTEEAEQERLRRLKNEEDEIDLIA